MVDMVVGVEEEELFTPTEHSQFPLVNGLLKLEQVDRRLILILTAGVMEVIQIFINLDLLILPQHI